MKTLIVGMGEVGKALSEVLAPFYPVATKDIEPSPVQSGVGIMHVCLRYSDEFVSIVRKYIVESGAKLVNICTTVPPGTTEKLGSIAVHSTTRGLHPNLVSGLKTFVKHVGGPKASLVSSYFEHAGVKCVVHARAVETELAHIMSNAMYGVNLMFADEMASLCRAYGVDYQEVVLRYNMTNNEGYEKLGHKSKARMLLSPPFGHIGGHCVVQGAQLIPADIRPPLFAKLAEYNN